MGFVLLFFDFGVDEEDIYILVYIWICNIDIVLGCKVFYILKDDFFFGNEVLILENEVVGDMID